MNAQPSPKNTFGESAFLALQNPSHARPIPWLRRWAPLGMGLALATAGVAAPAQAAESDATPLETLQATAGDDGLAFADDFGSDPLTASSELGMFGSEDLQLELNQYAPAPRPGRYYSPRYRYYRPSWRLRVLPPPIFAPGWFGVYFFGNPPPPPTYGPQYAPEQPPQQPEPAPVVKDFRHVGEYSVALTAGMHQTEYSGTGVSVTDPGARVALRYRNAPSLGAELAVGMFGSDLRFDGGGTEQRSDMPLQLSALLYAFPKAPIQPYLVLGATGNMRTYQYLYNDGSFGETYTEVRGGVHGGLGLELHVGDKMSFTVDTRRVLYTMVNRQVADQTAFSDRMVTGGLSLYF